MKALIKALNWLEWISAVAGGVLLLLALISLIVGHAIAGGSISSFFHAANSCFLLTIVLFLFIHLGQF